MVRRLGCAALIPKRDDQDPNVCEKHMIYARGPCRITGVNACFRQPSLTIVRRERGKTSLANIFVPLHWKCPRADGR
jgi:hypothetical protein